MTSNHMTLTWHLATNHIISSHVTSQPTTLFHLTPQPTTSKQVTTSPPWNGWRLVHTKNSVWASHWLAAFARILWAKTSAQLARLYLHILNETPASCALNMRGPCGPCVLFFFILHSWGFHIILFTWSQDSGAKTADTPCKLELRCKFAPT